MPGDLVDRLIKEKEKNNQEESIPVGLQIPAVLHTEQVQTCLRLGLKMGEGSKGPVHKGRTDRDD